MTGSALGVIIGIPVCGLDLRRDRQLRVGADRLPGGAAPLDAAHGTGSPRAPSRRVRVRGFCRILAVLTPRGAHRTNGLESLRIAVARGGRGGMGGEAQRLQVHRRPANPGSRGLRLRDGTPARGGPRRGDPPGRAPPLREPHRVRAPAAPAPGGAPEGRGRAPRPGDLRSAPELRPPGLPRRAARDRGGSGASRRAGPAGQLPLGAAPDHASSSRCRRASSTRAVAAARASPWPGPPPGTASCSTERTRTTRESVSGTGSRC